MQMLQKSYSALRQIWMGEMNLKVPMVAETTAESAVKTSKMYWFRSRVVVSGERWWRVCVSGVRRWIIRPSIGAGR